MSAVFESFFPHLSHSKYEITSPATDAYNCIAWAADVTDQWLWPDPLYEEFWPSQVQRTQTLDSFLNAFRTLGYEQCEQAELEPGFEKVALYASAGGIPTHAAKQLDSGQWSSKLGAQQDITHDSLDALAGETYGQAVVFLKRAARATL